MVAISLSRTLALTALTLTLAARTSPAQSVIPQTGTALPAPHVASTYGKLPLSFELNKGQSDPVVKFIARGPGYQLFLTSNKAVLSVHSGGAPAPRRGRAHPVGLEAPERPATPTASTVTFELAGSNQSAAVNGVDKLPGMANYFTGSDPAKWHTHVETFAKVRYSAIYPGIDLVYYGNQQGRLEHDFIVAPGIDPGVIAMRLSGTGKISQGENGDLHLATPSGDLSLLSPTVYQNIDRQRKAVAAHYILSANNEVRFQVGAYDDREPLVIDPVLSYATFVGSPGFDQANAIAVDSEGNAYITGITTSVDFPTTPGTYKPVETGTPTYYWNFVAKLNAAGTALIYATYIDGVEGSTEIAVDDDGDAYIAGAVGSTTYPTVHAFQPVSGGGVDSFVTKLSPLGDALIFSTYLGGKGSDYVYGIALDPQRNVYVTGSTDSLDFPTQNALQSSNKGGTDMFVTKINASGESLAYSTYLGGTGFEQAYGIAVDSAGEAYIAGESFSNDFPVKNALYPVKPAGSLTNSIGIIAKLNSAGSALVFSTYYGGENDYNQFSKIALDVRGNPVVVGQTSSIHFPVKNAYQSHLKDKVTSGTAVKLTADGQGVYYSTFLGEQDFAWGVAVDQHGTAYIIGETLSSFPTTANPFGSRAFKQNQQDQFAFIFTLSANGKYIPYYSVYAQGPSAYSPNPAIFGVAVDSKLNVYVAGYATAGATVTPNAFQDDAPGFGEAYVAKLVIAADLGVGVSAPSTVASGSNLTYTIATTNRGPDFASKVQVSDTLPAGTTFVSVNGGSGSCTTPTVGGTGTIHCVLPRLNSGQAYTVSAVVQVTATPGATLSNTATAASNMQDLVPNNNSGTATTTVQ